MYTRRGELKCTLEELEQYGDHVILYDGECIFVQQSDGSYSIKIGDGRTNLKELPYAVCMGEARALISQAAELKEQTARFADEVVAAIKVIPQVIEETLYIETAEVSGETLVL